MSLQEAEQVDSTRGPNRRDAEDQATQNASGRNKQRIRIS